MVAFSAAKADLCAFLEHSLTQKVSFASKIVVITLEDKRFDLARIGWVRKILNQVGFALNSTIRDFAHLDGIESLPVLCIEVFIEGHDEEWVYEVDECVADVAVVFQVDWQVEEVPSICV